MKKELLNKIKKELLDFSKDCKIINESIVVQNNLLKNINFIKEVYNFNILKHIKVIKMQDNSINLNYTLYSEANEEYAFIMFNTIDKAESIIKLFKNAAELETAISTNYKINFN